MRMKKLLLASSLLGMLASINISANENKYNEDLNNQQFLGNYLIDINVNNDDLSAGTKYDLSTVNNTFKKGMSYVGVNYFKTSAYDNNKQDMYEANLLVKDFIDMVPGLKIGVGLKVLDTKYEDRINNKNLSYIAIPFGLETEYILPVPGTVPISISAKGYYAPHPLTGADAYIYYEYGAQINAKLLSHINAYAGYRNINTSYENIGGIEKENVIYNSSFFFGVSIGI